MISIPIFTAQLEKARESTDQANLRDAYAVLSSAALTEETTAPTVSGGKIAYTFPPAPVTTASEWKATVTAVQTDKSKWSSNNGSVDVGGISVAVPGATGWEVVVKGDGTCTITAK